MKSINPLYILCLTLILSIGITTNDLGAYQRYNDGCDTCHEDFTNNFSTKPGNIWPDSKHNVHRRDMLDNVCNACHLDGDDWDPYLNQSNGTNDLQPIGCLGCHGRYYESATSYMGSGLRAHHAVAGITGCSLCHDIDPEPLLENVLPEFYGQQTVNINHPCNQDSSENWTPDGLGLDNDGDGLYDLDDGDCDQVSIQPDVGANGIPRAFRLEQNYPNPLNPSTTISFDLPGTGMANMPTTLTIYDLRGKCIRELVHSNLAPGHHRIHWDGRNSHGESVGSGIYIYRLQAGEDTFTRKMTVLK